MSASGEVGAAVTVAGVMLMLAGFQVMRWRVARSSPADVGLPGRHLFLAVGFALIAAASLAGLADRDAGTFVNGIGFLALLAGVGAGFLWRRRAPTLDRHLPPRPDQAPAVANDPGWGPALDLLKRGFLLIPALRMLPLRDGLLTLRFLFLSFIPGSVLMGIAFSFIAPWPGEPRLVHGFVLGIGIASTALASWNARRSLSLESPVSLASSYRSRMFAGVAIAQIPLLVSLAATFLAHGLWIYLVGLAFASVNLWRISPGPRRLAADQAAITAAGSSFSLVAALRAMPHPAR